MAPNSPHAIHNSRRNDDTLQRRNRNLSQYIMIVILILASSLSPPITSFSPMTNTHRRRRTIRPHSFSSSQRKHVYLNRSSFSSNKISAPQSKWIKKNPFAGYISTNVEIMKFAATVLFGKLREEEGDITASFEDENLNVVGKVQNITDIKNKNEISVVEGKAVTADVKNGVEDEISITKESYVTVGMRKVKSVEHSVEIPLLNVGHDIKNKTLNASKIERIDKTVGMKGNNSIDKAALEQIKAAYADEDALEILRMKFHRSNDVTEKIQSDIEMSMNISEARKTANYTVDKKKEISHEIINEAIHSSPGNVTNISEAVKIVNLTADGGKAKEEMTKRDSENVTNISEAVKAANFVSVQKESKPEKIIKKKMAQKISEKAKNIFEAAKALNFIADAKKGNSDEVLNEGIRSCSENVTKMSEAVKTANLTADEKKDKKVKIQNEVIQPYSKDGLTISEAVQIAELAASGEKDEVIEEIKKNVVRPQKSENSRTVSEMVKAAKLAATFSERKNWDLGSVVVKNKNGVDGLVSEAIPKNETNTNDDTSGIKFEKPMVMPETVEKKNLHNESISVGGESGEKNFATSRIAKENLTLIEPDITVSRIEEETPVDQAVISKNPDIDPFIASINGTKMTAQQRKEDVEMVMNVPKNETNAIADISAIEHEKNQIDPILLGSGKNKLVFSGVARKNRSLIGSDIAISRIEGKKTVDQAVIANNPDEDPFLATTNGTKTVAEQRKEDVEMVKKYIAEKEREERVKKELQRLTQREEKRRKEEMVSYHNDTVISISTQKRTLPSGDGNEHSTKSVLFFLKKKTIFLVSLTIVLGRRLLLAVIRKIF